jgi:hypothetical protein
MLSPRIEQPEQQPKEVSVKQPTPEDQIPFLQLDSETEQQSDPIDQEREYLLQINRQLENTNEELFKLGFKHSSWPLISHQQLFSTNSR